MPETPRPATWHDLIRVEARAAQVPEALALALAEQESGFNPAAKSRKGAIGLFQLMPQTAADLGVNPADSFENIRGGLRYFKAQLDASGGDVQRALANYNAGPGGTPEAGYVEGVLRRLPRWQGTTLAAQTIGQGGGPPAPSWHPPQVGGAWHPPMQTVGTTTTPPPPEPGFLRSAVAAFDPRERQGRRNLAAAGGAIAGGLTGGTGLAATALGILGAGTAGGAEELGEQVVHGEPLTLLPGTNTGEQSSVLGAAGQQAAYEGLTPPILWPLKAVGRRLAAAPVYRNALAALERTQEGAMSRLRSTAPPALRPSHTGQMVEAVAQGPAKQTLDRMGAAVGEAAESGPPIPAEPLRERLAGLAEEITPMADEASAMTVKGDVLPEAVARRIRERNPDLALLPPEHPLPATLNRIRDMLADHETIPYADAHKIKILLNNAVNWDRPAKSTAEQITKGFQQTLRKSMQGHAPYDQATAAYASAVPLFRNKSLVAGLHKQAVDNPGAIVPLIKGFGKTAQPTRLRNLFAVLGEYAAESGGEAEGQAATDAVRAAWTHANLITGNPAKITERIAKLDPEFAEVMYGDAAGRTVLQNLKQIGTVLDTAVAQQTALKGSSIARPHDVTVVSDVLRTIFAPFSSYGMTSEARLFIQGPKIAELLQWMSYSPERTQLFVKAVTNPVAAMTLANMARAAGVLGEGGLLPMPSHGGPPKPRVLSIPAGLEDLPTGYQRRLPSGQEWTRESSGALRQLP